MRAKKPLFKRIDKSLSLNFEGRVKKPSRKNIQIVSDAFNDHILTSGVQI